MFIRSKEQIIPARSGLRKIHRRENSALGELTVQDHFHVAGSLEFLINHIVHLGAGFNQSRSKNGKRSSLAHITGCSEKALGHVQCHRIETTGKCSSAGGLCQVVGSRQSRNGIQKNHDIALALHQTLCTLDGHLRNSLVVLRQLIKRGIDHFHIRSLQCLTNIRDFLGTLINQKDNEVNVRIIGLDRLGNLFHQSGFAGLRR